MTYRLLVVDPRDPTGEHTLDVIYTARRGAPPIRDDVWGGDPGYGPEYEVAEATNKRDRCVLSHLTSSQFAALIDGIHAEHQFDG